MDYVTALPASTDVVIVGAGPTGLSMACALAGYGGLYELGGTVHRPVRVTEAREIGDGFEVSLVDGAGRASAVRCGYLVGCDGLHSTVRTELGVEFRGATYEQSFVLADVRMDWGIARDEVNLFFSPEGLVVVAPFGSTDTDRGSVESAPERPGAGDVQELTSGATRAGHGAVSAGCWLPTPDRRVGGHDPAIGRRCRWLLLQPARRGGG